jgi:MoaA/NifB/PqqE/SkfB family radical SAM enzyme/GT2 family glycosyltransferase
MKTEMPLVSIITVNYNGKALLEDCFNSLLASNYPKDKIEIFMVDNGSQDGSVDYARKEFACVKVILNSENNYAKANNLAIKEARGEFIALVNNDIKAEKDWLIHLVEAARRDPLVGAVGSKILFMDGSVQSVGHQEYPNFYWGDIGFRDTDGKQYEIEREVVSICGCAVLYRRKCLDEAGYFDEDFNMFLEDVDMSIRCRNKGWKLLVCPGSVIYHKFHQTIASEENARNWQEANRLLLIAKHWPEKLADALHGKGYFAALERGSYENVKDIGLVLGKAYLKLVKEHGEAAAGKLSPDLFKAICRIRNLERDHFIQDIKDKISIISERDKEIVFRDQQINALGKEIEAFWKKYNEDLASLRVQKDQELSVRDQQINALGKEIEAFWKKYNEDLASLRDTKDQEIASRDRQITLLKEELQTLEQGLIAKEQSTADLARDLTLKIRDLNNIYNSTGYRYFLKPAWGFLWSIKKKLARAKGLVTVLKDKYLKFSRLCEEISKACIGAIQVPGFSLSNNDFRKAYLGHLKHDTFPLMPKRIILMITRNCNLKCSFCDIPAAEKKEKMMQMADAARTIDSAERLGVKEIVLTGGEPLLHPHLFEMAELANAKNMKVTLTTNGILIRPNLENILKTKFSCICVSIDGKEDTHDNLRNHKGAYKDALDAIELLKQHQIDTAVNFVVTNRNISDLEDVYNFFFARNIKVIFLPVINKPDLFVTDKKARKSYLRFIRGLFRGGNLSIHEYNYLKDAINDYSAKKDTSVRCLGLNSEFGVDTDGAISPCCVWENKKKEINNLGNMFKEDLEELWFSPRFRQARLAIFQEGCKDCFNPSIHEFKQLTGLNYLVRRGAKKDLVNGDNRVCLPSKPNHVHFRFTSRCNLSCKHCDIWKRSVGDDSRGELSSEEWIKGIDKLYNWLGRFRLDLAGGEILLYKDAISLIEYCARKRISVSLTTNATLIDDKVADRLSNSGLYAINLSLDGLALTHEYTRNQKDIYYKVEQAVFNLLKYRKTGKPYISMATVITSRNLKELEKMVQLVGKWGVDGITFQALDHNFGAKYCTDWFENNEFWPKDQGKIEAAINNLIKAKVSGVNITNSLRQLNDIRNYYRDPVAMTKYRCETGNNNFIIDEYGGVRLCWNMEPVGDILKQSPQEIWFSQSASRMRGEIRSCVRTCRLLNCNYSG